MRLSGQQYEELVDALIDAFPNKESLVQMLRFELDKNLRVIVDNGSLKDIVFKLIEIANSEEWVEDLICAACNSNSGNLKLQKIIQLLIVKNSFCVYNIIQSKLGTYDYYDLEELGTGISGVTYRASRKNDKNYVVIKTIKPDLLYQIIKSENLESKDFLQSIKSFKREAEILSNSRHHNIVPYHEHLNIKLKFIINKTHTKPHNKPYSVYTLELLFILMKYIEGQNLEQFLSERDDSLQEAEALDYIQQIGNALTFIHDKDVLHQDIKPQNIMLCKATNNAILIDFGIARKFNPVTQTHTVSFTQGYAPPEQLEPKSGLGNYTDIYGLAMFLCF